MEKLTKENISVGIKVKFLGNALSILSFSRKLNTMKLDDDGEYFIEDRCGGWDIVSTPDDCS